jgi:hypothetical protein
VTQNGRRPAITVNRGGVRQVSPREILRSDVGKEQIRKTHAVVVARKSASAKE